MDAGRDGYRTNSFLSLYEKGEQDNAYTVY